MINEQFPCLGVHSTATNHCRGAKFFLLHADTQTSFVFEVRAFDDGVAFRHMVPGTGLRTPDARDGIRNSQGECGLAPQSAGPL